MFLRHPVDLSRFDKNLYEKAYSANIVYGDMARFQRDYLLHTFYKKLVRGDRTQIAVVVDEVDNMLLDNGNNMLYLSHTVPGIDLLDSLLVFVQQQIHAPIFSGDKNDLASMQQQFDHATIKRRVLADLFGHFSIQDLGTLVSSCLNEEEVKKIYDQLIQGNVIDGDGYLKIHVRDKLTLIDTALKPFGSGFANLIKACFSVIMLRERAIELPMYLKSFAKLHLDELIENCKQALFLEPNTGYVVDVDRTGKIASAIEPLITIIDSNTGADLASSQWTGGLHQFLQLKHGCRLSPMSLKAVFVSNVAYLKRYEYINGLSGTLGSAEESKTLIELYQADLIKIPTNKPKVFYEHVPVIAVVREQWIANIYDEICDQVSAKRAVLVICEDIKQLEYVHTGLIRLFGEDVRASKEVKECFLNVTTYKREHDEFNFEDENKFEPHRLIIATNLAGRGTDIKLSDEVIAAGGMHVIVAFMPKNCRIEEQAFGRAARCGQPGSGQIIAYAEPLANAPQPSVFQLKMFRDNAEVHRLQSLNSFYKYHTEIEESCLEIFHSYIDSALSKMYNSAESSEAESALPTPSQVVYFTLLDQWALWLDSKAPLIKQCSIEYSDKLKEAIIGSVKDFKDSHAFEDKDKGDCFEVAKGWIVSPQALLTIGIIQMSHKEGFREAEDTFNRVLADGPEFAGEAFYYKACMRMRNFTGLRKTIDSLKLAKKEKFKEDIEEAIEYFYKARTAFLHRLQRKAREGSLVAQMIEKLPANNPKTSGYASQIKSIMTHIQMILANIDYLLGSPCDQSMFAGDGISDTESKKVHDLFVRQGVISPTLFTGRSSEDWQMEPLKRKYKLHRQQIEAMLKEISDNSTSLMYEKYIALDQGSLIESCPLSTKSDFWVELESQHCLRNTVVCLLVQDPSVLSSALAQQLNMLKSFSLENPDDVRALLESAPKQPPETTSREPALNSTLQLSNEIYFLNSTQVNSTQENLTKVNPARVLRYSSEVTRGALYKLDDVKKLVANNRELMSEINQLVDSGRIKLDKLAEILIVPEAMTYFSKFDGITFNDLKEFFRLDDNGCAWILNNLVEKGVLVLETVKMMRITLDSSIWEALVRSHLKAEAKQPKEDSPIELKLIYAHAGNLQAIKDTPRILNVSKEAVGSFCNLPKDETLDKFYAYLETNKILEPYLYNIWRQNSKLNCSSLPSCIADHVDEFLADRFAYAFALEKVCMSLEEACKDPTPTPSQVFLPENPFRDLADDLVNSGLAMPARICASSETFEDIDFDDFKNADHIKSIVYSNRLKLYDQTDFHMELLPFATYVHDQGLLVDSDLNNMINNGLKFAVGRKRETTASYLLSKVLSFAAKCWNAIKFVANKIASFGYAVVKFAVHLPGKIFSKICDFAAPYVKQVGALVMRIAQPLLNTKLGKAAASAVKATVGVAVEAAYKLVEGAEWVIGKGKQVTNKVVSVAGDVANWVAETRVVKGAIGYVKDAAAWVASTSVFQAAISIATYVYTKVSNFCTAIAESYHYYNQCRTIARRIANEKIGLVDEHTIIKAFQGISQQEAKKIDNDHNADDNIRKNIESWRTPLTQSLLTAFNNKLNTLADNKYTIDFVKSFLKASSSFSSLESELTNLLNFYAWTKQIAYFKQIKACFESQVPLMGCPVQIALEQIPADMLFFVEDAIDQIMSDLQSRSEDEAYASDTESGDAEMANLVDSEKHATWKEALRAVFGNRVHRSVEFAFIEKTISVVLSYMAAMRNTNMDPSEAQLGFIQEDKQLKQALVEYTSSNQSKQNAKFLVAELHHITGNLIDANSDGNHPQALAKIIRHAIKYGYPLPLSAAKLVAIAFDRFLRQSNIYSGGIDLMVADDNGHVAVVHKVNDGKARVHIRHFNGSVFICQSDYRASIGMSDQMREEVDKAFFYESFISHMKPLKEKFPKKAETLRIGLLGALCERFEN